MVYVRVLKADGSLAMGAAVSYLSHLYGKRFPPSVGIFTEVDVCGNLTGTKLKDATLHAARKAGISIIILSLRQVSRKQSILELTG
jgi:hypothetical protein